MVSLDMNDISGRSSYWMNGQLQSVAVNPTLSNGITVFIQNFSLYGRKNIQVWSEEKMPLIGFSTILSGVCQVFCHTPRSPLGDGVSYVQFPGYKPPVGARIQANTPVTVLAELVDMLEMVDSNARKKGAPRHPRQMDIAQKLCGCQAFESFVASPHDTLFLEAKALELIALQLRQLEYLTGKIPQGQPVNHHMEKIQYACEILKKEMTDPPDKLTLARRVGLNHDQLFQGFKEFLGLCPFEYLRILRLEKAKELIASREYNVTEAALTVGYSSLSHFTKNFRREFGITPKNFQKATGKHHFL